MTFELFVYALAMAVQAAAFGVAWRLLGRCHPLFRAQIILLAGGMLVATVVLAVLERSPGLVAVVTGLSLLFQTAVVVSAITVGPVLASILRNPRTAEADNGWGVLPYVLAPIVLLGVAAVVVTLGIPEPFAMGVLALGAIVAFVGSEALVKLARSRMK